MDNWHKLQSLLDTLDSNTEKNNEQSSDEIAILENSTDPSQDGNKNTLTLIDALNTNEMDSDKGSSSKTNLVSILKTHEKTNGSSESHSKPKHSSEKKTREFLQKFRSKDDEQVPHQPQRRFPSWGYDTKSKSTPIKTEKFSSSKTNTKPGPASLKPMPFSKKKENTEVETARMIGLQALGSVGRNQSVETGELRRKNKPKPLSMKTEPQEKKATSCGRCANCQINKQIKR